VRAQNYRTTYVYIGKQTLAKSAYKLHIGTRFILASMPLWRQRPGMSAQLVCLHRSADNCWTYIPYETAYVWHSCKIAQPHSHYWHCWDLTSVGWAMPQGDL